MCTEAGLLALRERRMCVTQEDFVKAKEKVGCWLIAWCDAVWLLSVCVMQSAAGLLGVMQEGLGLCRRAPACHGEGLSCEGCLEV